MSFGGNERYIGEAATTQIRTNMDNTVTQFKRLLGRKFSEPGVQADLETHLNYRVKQLPGDDIGIEVRVCALARESDYLARRRRAALTPHRRRRPSPPPLARRWPTTARRASSRRRRSSPPS